MGSFHLKRRTLLRGLGSAAAVALPMLGATSPRARAAEGDPPKRFVIMFAGMSTGTSAGGGTHGDMLVPDAVGPGYDLKRAALALGSGALPIGGTGYGVQDEVSIVSGLEIPWDTGGGVPPGGRSPQFHYNTLGPQLSGVRGNTTRTGAPQGPSVDQVVADAIAGDTTQRVLTYRVQPARYVGSNGGGGDSGRVSWRREPDGNLVGVDPIASPRLAHQSLFTGFVPPDPAEARSAQFLLRRRQSVVDTIRERTESVLPKLGAVDRQRMQRHLDEIRNLEQRLDTLPPPTEGACELLPDPGDDPPIGQPHNTQENGNLDYTESAGYSNEDVRAEIFGDLVHMAFACDLTRVAAVRMTMDQCFMNMKPISGANGDVHGLSHGLGDLADLSDAVGWHVKHFARLVAKLRDTIELDGSSMLDNTVVVLLFEGGHGFDPEGSNAASPHSTENMSALIAGRAGGLSPGQHVATGGLHPANVLISAMSAVGHPDETLGDISGRIPELFG